MANSVRKTVSRAAGVQHQNTRETQKHNTRAEGVKLVATREGAHGLRGTTHTHTYIYTAHR